MLILLALGTPASADDILALVGGTVIDVDDWGRSEEDLENAVVLVEGHTISAVGRRDQIEIPPGAEILDVSGRFIVPGLTDGFAAINNQAYADAYLQGGVTSIIAVSGGRRGNLFTDAKPGPHVNVLQSVGSERASLEEHLEAIEAWAEEGVDILLLMYKLTPEQLSDVTTLAEELGMGTIGELGLASYADGIRAGIDAFVHTTRYSLNMAPPKLAQQVAEQPFSDDLDSPKWIYYKWLSQLSPYDERLTEHAELLGSGAVTLMPTLSLLYLDLPWSENPWTEPVARLLDPADINNPADPETGRHDSEPAHQAAYSALARSEYILEETYHRAGARYLAGSGTDVWGTMPGISIHHELEGLVRIGLTPREALAAATSNFEQTFAGWGKVGRVQPGYRADLLVLFGDPRLDVVNLRAIDRLILAGELVEPRSAP
ncbi:MAG: hypothetical protein WBG96_06680 [Thermoanaerobaculia bacterium]